MILIMPAGCFCQQNIPIWPQTMKITFCANKKKTRIIWYYFRSISNFRKMGALRVYKRKAVTALWVAQYQCQCTKYGEQHAPWLIEYRSLWLFTRYYIIYVLPQTTVLLALMENASSIILQWIENLNLDWIFCHFDTEHIERWLRVNLIPHFFVRHSVL